MKIELELSDELYADLELLAAELDIPDITSVALGAIMQWVEARKGEQASRDPSQRYFINEALDELLERQKKSD